MGRPWRAADGRAVHCSDDRRQVADGFRHGALFYAGDDEFLAAANAFVRHGLSVGEPAMVAVSQTKIAALRSELGAEAKRVQFIDIDQVGANPARIIPVWKTFLDEQGSSDRPARGIGEPIWPSRRPDELVEAQQHESLLNHAFAAADNFWLLCPYDTSTLDAAVIAQARRTHPRVTDNGAEAPSATYEPLDASTDLLGAPLSPAPSWATEYPIDVGTLVAIRQTIECYAIAAGADSDQTERLVTSTNEAITNTLRHAGGHGRLRLWHEADRLTCEVLDGGLITNPLVGRISPEIGAEEGRGLWIANQLCDLVQLRSFSSGTVVRLHVLLHAGPIPSTRRQ